MRMTVDTDVVDVDLWNSVRVYVAAVHIGTHIQVAHMMHFNSFLLQAAPLIAANRIATHIDTLQPLDWRRSVHAAQAMHPSGQFTHLFMYDTDMEISFAHLQQLLRRKVDIVSGTYFMGGIPMAGKEGAIPRPFPCVASRDHSYISREEIIDADKADRLISVHSVGGGCLLVSVEALGRIGVPAFQYNWRIGGGWTEPEFEDGWFSRMARNAGYELFMDPRVQPAHFKFFKVGLEIRDMNNTIVSVPAV